MNIKSYINDFEKNSREEFESKQYKLLFELNKFHFNNCSKYLNFVNAHFSENMFNDVSSLPYLPVDVFKRHRLITCGEENIFKILNSSGTTGQIKSQIFLDKYNARNQAIALSKIFTQFTGLNRPNMLIIDSPDLLQKRNNFSARVAGIIGFSSLCRKREFALNSNYQINEEAIEKLIEASENSQILIFGFTSIIWQYFLKYKFKNSIKSKLRDKGVLMHGGGWKKLENKNISKDYFYKKINNLTGIKNIFNYYGMVEQTGSIFIECSKGYLHTNPLCDIISRSKNDLSVNPLNIEGIAQVLSVLPTSYPGFSLLTDDLVTIKHINNCPCGRKGKSFKINGRIKKSEIRGCSDTFSG